MRFRLLLVDVCFIDEVSLAARSEDIVPLRVGGVPPFPRHMAEYGITVQAAKLISIMAEAQIKTEWKQASFKQGPNM